MKKREANFIFTNGTIITVDTNNNIVSAVACKEGKIVAVGHRDEVMEWCGTHTKVVDLKGKTMLPGFFDPHSHIVLASLKLAFANLNPAPMGPVANLTDLKQVLLDHKEKKKLQNGQWLIGIGYDDTILEEKRHPTRRDLDAISSEHPILVMHISMHLLAANSIAFELAGITKETLDPEGGVIRRVEGTQEPNGILEEQAMLLLLKAVPKPSEEELGNIIENGLHHYAAQGITTTQEAAISSPDIIETLRKLAADKRLPIDVIGFPFWNITDATLTNYDEDRYYRGRFRLGGVKLVLDGSIQGYTAYLSEPYHISPEYSKPVDDDPTDWQTAENLLLHIDASTAIGEAHPEVQIKGYLGYPTFEDQDEVTKLVKKFYKEGWPVLCHTNGDAATDMLVKAISEAAKEYPVKNLRTVIIHGQTIREDQLDQIKELEMVISFFPNHVYYWGDRHHDIFLGPKRAARINPLNSALNREIVFTIHHDAPVTPANILHIIWAAVNRVTTSGKVLGPNQQIPVIEAIRAVTINAAYQHFEEKMKGSIEIGKLADFVILSDNPLKVDPMKINDITVLETIKEGKTVYNSLINQ